jgi:ribosomal protein S18 acetylase RimI-like enzyme
MENIRAATLDDLTSVKDIVRTAYTPYISRIGRAPGPLLDDYVSLIKTGRIFVAEHNGMVQGILVLIPQKDAMLLDNIAVAPQAQGSGLGRLLFKFTEHRAIAMGLRSITLYTNESMTDNIALYTRIGFVETHRIVEKGLRRVYMSKRL